MMSPQLLPAIGSNASAFANMASNASQLSQASQALQALQRALARRFSRRCGKLNAAASQAVLPIRGVLGDDGQPEAFAAVSQNSAAMAALSSNPKALEALSAQPNMAALMANPSFSAALNQAGVAQSHSD